MYTTGKHLVWLCSGSYSYLVWVCSGLVYWYLVWVCLGLVHSYLVWVCSGLAHSYLVWVCSGLVHSYLVWVCSFKPGLGMLRAGSPYLVWVCAPTWRSARSTAWCAHPGAWRWTGRRSSVRYRRSSSRSTAQGALSLQRKHKRHSVRWKMIRQPKIKQINKWKNTTTSGEGLSLSATESHECLCFQRK